VAVNEWAPAVTFSVIALSAGAAVVLRGPMGQALAEWIRGWSHTERKWIEAKAGAPTMDVEALHAELDEMRRRLAETEERLDFTERMLTKQREAERIGLPPPGPR
jgi:hypothetical protein